MPLFTREPQLAEPARAGHLLPGRTERQAEPGLSSATPAPQGAAGQGRRAPSLQSLGQ